MQDVITNPTIFDGIRTTLKEAHWPATDVYGIRASRRRSLRWQSGASSAPLFRSCKCKSREKQAKTGHGVVAKEEKEKWQPRNQQNPSST
jgi:hypothetical protein